MDELVERVRLALAAQYPGAPNGRVRDLPDRRAIRWYATTGLVDRPTAMRGRTALYGHRHLLQLVAVKRRQADGRTLAEIQVELAGATDATLARIARVPDELLVDAGPPADGSTAVGPETDGTAGGSAETVRARFWASAPAATTAARSRAAASRAATSTDPTSTDPTSMAVDSAWTDPLSMTMADDGPTKAHHPHAVPLTGVALGGGAVLLLPGRPSDDDCAAIASTAAPLIDLLAARGLLTTGGAGTAHGRPSGGGRPTTASTEAHPQSGLLTHHDGSSR